MCVAQTIIGYANVAPCRDYHHCQALLSNILHLFSFTDHYAYVLLPATFGYSTVHNAHSSVSSIFNPTSSSFSCKDMLPFIQKCLGMYIPLFTSVCASHGPHVFSCNVRLLSGSQTLHCQRSVFL